MRSEGTITIDCEPLVATAYGAVVGALPGGVVGMLMPSVFRHFRVLAPPLTRDQFAGLFARECAAISASGFGINSLLRGNDDLKSRLLLGSGAGLAYPLVTRGLKVRPPHLLSYAAAYAVMSAAMYKMNQIIIAKSERSTSGKAFDT
ncbi:unnamed protein product [Eruca vesicaria subsp. sativa]|uniref:Uncharacterized protein n=1 Tax=Eruca vesicaria subsp. sativa TaxID=29727 RepID=A0ABC8L9R4_ERUVS|nr:unnamed protein product [Eruca vesicaria subsp. sativa]